MPLMAVANAALPLPVVFKVNVTVWLPVAPPSVVFAVPDKVTVALSLSVTFTVPLPVELTEALLLVPVRLELNDSGPSTNLSSAAVTVIEVVAPLRAPLANEAVLAV